ncbi:MAG: hypothetical protein IPL20_16810 [Saprospiraceae bacterium]|nr:hypothetical protein [Saprospiraceae bacterium]
METNQKSKKFQKNLIWILLLFIMIFLAMYVGYKLFLPNKSDGPIQTGTTSGAGGLDTPKPPTSTELNILDPSPVYAGEDFSISLEKDNEMFNKSFFIDNVKICMGRKICKTKIATTGIHKLKICIDNMDLCGEIKVAVINRAIQNDSKTQIKDVPIIEKPTSIKDVKEQKRNNDFDDDGTIDESDNCPKRKGSKSNNGCPEINLKGNNTFTIGQVNKIKVEYEDPRPNDQIKWTGNELLIFTSRIGKEVEISSEIVGKYRINLEITNSQDGLQINGSNVFHVQISNSRLESELMNLAEYGNNARLGVKQFDNRRKKSEEFLEKCFNGNISLKKLTSSGISSTKNFSIFKDELLSVKRTIDTQIQNITVTDITYEENSGKIQSFKYRLN